MIVYTLSLTFLILNGEFLVNKIIILNDEPGVEEKDKNLRPQKRVAFATFNQMLRLQSAIRLTTPVRSASQTTSEQT